MGARKLGAMGRKRIHNRDLPARVYLRHGAYYFVDPTGKWHRLGTTKPAALRAYADLLQTGITTFANVVDRYVAVIMPRKAPKTQAEQMRQLTRLLGVFGKMSAAQIRRGHIAQYRDARPPVAANRELALMSHIMARALEWEMVQDNPCVGVERNTETPRDRIVTNEEFDAVFDSAPGPVQGMMLLAYLTGQREGDLLKLRRDAITDAGLMFRQGKTGKRLCVQWTPALREAVAFAQDLPRAGVASTYLVVNERGQPYSSSGFQTAWQRHIRSCVTSGVLTERFTFHDLRAKAGSEATDTRLLGHSDQRLMQRVYRRLPEIVRPTR